MISSPDLGRLAYYRSSQRHILDHTITTTPSRLSRHTLRRPRRLRLLPRLRACFCSPRRVPPTNASQSDPPTLSPSICCHSRPPFSAHHCHNIPGLVMSPRPHSQPPLFNYRGLTAPTNLKRQHACAPGSSPLCSRDSTSPATGQWTTSNCPITRARRLYHIRTAHG